MEKSQANGEVKGARSVANGKTSGSQALPSGLKVEVYIDTLPPGQSIKKAKRSPAPSSGAEDPPESDIDLEVPRKSRRRGAPKKVMISSDDEDSTASEEEKVKKPKKASKPQARKKASKASSESSDYEDSAAEDTESEVDVDESSPTSDAESTAPKRVTSKPKAAPPSKSSKKKSETSSSDGTTDNDDMDVDDDDVPAKGKKATKRKAADNDERPTKKQKRANSDPWKLESRAVQKDWTKMQALPLEMFHFARKVVDEYTYLDGKIHALVTRLTAERHWVLSGTPPIHDFGALKTIAAFLNLHLGVDDDAEGRSAEIKKRRKEQTGT